MASGTSALDGYRIGLVGAGGIAHEHLPGWLRAGAEVSVFSLAGADQLVSEVGGGVVCESLEQLLDRVHAVDVCVPTPGHAAVVEQSAGAGRHVLCEKPLGRTAEQARRMITVCREAGVQLYPGHVVRYFPAYATMHAAVVDGEVGTVAVQRYSRTGSRPRMRWFHDAEQSGGIVMDQMIHDIDQAVWNAGEVVSVFARSRRAGDVETGVDTAQLIMTHTGGAITTVSGTWARPGTRFRTTAEIAGSAGVLSHDSTEHPGLAVDAGAPVRDGSPPDGTGLLPALGAESPFALEIADIGQAFRGGPPPRVSALDGLRAVIIAEAANASLASGRTVGIEPLGEAVGSRAEVAS